MTCALPAAGEVHVRRIDLDHESALPGILPDDERARAGRFRFEQDARRWSVCRSRLRQILGAYLDTAPEDLRFETGPWGKPGLPGCPLRFNVSHSGPAALLAFAWEQEVGVDIERKRSDFSPNDLAAQVFSVAEQVWLARVPANGRHEAFLTLWTAKEACIKARGEGLSFPLTQLTLTPLVETGSYAVEDLTTDPAHPPLSVRQLNAEADYLAALALEGPISCVQRFHPTDERSSD